MHRLIQVSLSGEALSSPDESMPPPNFSMSFFCISLIWKGKGTVVAVTIYSGDGCDVSSVSLESASAGPYLQGMLCLTVSSNFCSQYIKALFCQMSSLHDRLLIMSVMDIRQSGERVSQMFSMLQKQALLPFLIQYFFLGEGGFFTGLSSPGTCGPAFKKT